MQGSAPLKVSHAPLHCCRGLSYGVSPSRCLDVFLSCSGMPARHLLQMRAELAKVDILVVPTSAYNYTVQEIQVNEINAQSVERRDAPPGV